MKQEVATVTQMLRYARRVGDNYLTGEMSLCLPTNATAQDIADAIKTGVLIAQAMQPVVVAAVEEAALQTISDGNTTPRVSIRNPDDPPTQAQLGRIESVRQNKGWSSGQMESFARQQGFEMSQLNKGQASKLIDLLKE